MSSQTSEYLRQYVIEHMLIGADHPSPTNLYLGLFTEDPEPAGSGAEVDSSDTNYVRQEIAWVYTGGEASNSLAVNFPTADTSWGTVTHWAVFDAVVGGNMLYFGEADLPRDTEVGVQIIIPVGLVRVDPSGAS